MPPFAEGGSDFGPGIFDGGGEEEFGVWRGYQGDFGDYYREADNVVRGVHMGAMAQDVPDAFGPSCFNGFGASDFYGASEEVHRGSVFNSFGEAGDFLTKYPDLVLGVTEDSTAELFTEADHPPPMTSDPFLMLGNSMLYISSSTPHDIGNHLLFILRTKVVSNVTKVNRKKFTIKAEAFVGNTMCKMKIRIYAQEEDFGSYSIEFQNRSGDRLAFCKIYQDISKCLEVRFGATANANGPDFGGDLAMPLPLLPLPPVADGGDFDVGCFEAEAGCFQAAPLVDMAGRDDRPDLQMEAAVALADMAEDAQAAETLCTPTFFEDFKSLLKHDELDVAYPTSRLLCSLVQCTEAKHCFADKSLLLTIIDKVQSKSSSTLVQKQMQQVLAAAIPRCASALTEEATSAVLKNLEQAIQGTDAMDSLRRTLQEAHVVLLSRQHVRAT